MTDAAQLAPAWAQWIEDNLADGAAPEDIIQGLIEADVPPARAQVEVYRRHSQRLTAERDALAAICDRQTQQWRHGPQIERRATPSPPDFFAHYVAANRPVVLTDYTEGWPARRWTLSALAERFGHAPVDVTLDRESDPDYDMRHQRHTHQMPLADYIARVQRAGSTNDLYMVANNRNADRPELAGLLDDLSLRRGLQDRARLKGCVALWIGPKGTLTPLHHDTCNILFCQLVGRKRFTIYPPHTRALLHGARAMYAGYDPKAPDPTHPAHRATPCVLDLGPGESLFIPIGWWHHVESLDVSVSVAFGLRPSAGDGQQPAAGASGRPAASPPT